MNQLPVFVNLRGANVVLVGTGEAADAKRRLIERAGGTCVDDCPHPVCRCAKIAFIALDEEDAAIAAADRLRAKGMLVNVVDRPGHCDFTTPAIIDRDPVLVAIGTGGASAGLAKAIRQRIEALLPQSLGQLATEVLAARDAIRKRWPEPNGRRRALDNAFQSRGSLDPLADHSGDAVARWLTQVGTDHISGLIEIVLASADPDDLTLRHARLLGEADHVFYASTVPEAILARVRADAVRHAGAPGAAIPEGLVLYLMLPNAG
jgi:uroporphyrin-III C-methyltransferase / precorrin-2 dehydrogenase / sirohydrochlorin ferrochelatase